MNYELITNWTPLIVIIIIWDFTWKGFTLWRAARNGQLKWFVALMVINSVGILPIVYLLTHKPASKPE